MTQNPTFIRPPDAPVFYPTEEEFGSPLLYIQSIKAEAEKYGICKIVPPKTSGSKTSGPFASLRRSRAQQITVEDSLSFKPPFAVNKETFRFKARYQRLSDLDGFSRSRHSFACMLRRFWADQACFELGVIKECTNVKLAPECQGEGWPAELGCQTVGEKVVDWYDLYISVHRLNGYKAVCAMPDGWVHVARCLGIPYASFPNAMKDLKTSYEKNLLPYDEFRDQVELYAGIDTPLENTCIASSRWLMRHRPMPVDSLPPHQTQSQSKYVKQKDRGNSYLRKGAPVNKSAGCRRLEKNPERSEETCELPALPKKKQEHPVLTNEIVGNGNGLSPSPKSGDGSSSPGKDEKRARARRSTSQSEMVCEVCKQTDDFDNLKFCEKCETTYHLRCIPQSIRKDKAKLWLCPRCMKETYDGLRSCHTFGFDHTHALYTLEEFQKKANEFKRNHFGHMNVGLQAVEAEFWRLLGDPLGETVVEYGADLHRGELGSSGFPTDNDRPFLRESEKEYIDHPWNLNKLPDNELSILKHITAQISEFQFNKKYCSRDEWNWYGGMMPYKEKEMVIWVQEKNMFLDHNKSSKGAFKVFAFDELFVSLEEQHTKKTPKGKEMNTGHRKHTEDHWSASINYLHMGEPKTWYGVPGSYAEAFETAFKQLVPVLTESNPDLLHQLVTHMNPTVLQACAVPVYRTDQRAGEFIVTYPRAYHAGFNQGFNFAEAVNFCLADWIPHGRLSINHYSNCKRDLVFSHDELICCMADQASMLHQTIARACHKDFLHMVAEESANRQHLIDLGIVLDDEPTLFEFMDDHERSCSTCHTTLFLSAVQCMCSNEKLACGKHAEQLCLCVMGSRRLLYRYTIDDLNILLDKLFKRSEEAESLGFKPSSAVIATTSVQKRTAATVEGRPGKRQKFLTSQDSPMDFFGDYEGTGNSELKAVMKMASELVSPQTITRGRDAGEVPAAVKRWKLEDVEGLVSSLSNFAGTSKEINHIREYVRKHTALENEIRTVLQVPPEDHDLEMLRRIFDQARSTNIQIDALEELQLIVQQTEFRERIAAAINDPRSNIASIAEVLQTADELYVRSPFVEKLVGSITRLIDEGRNLEIDAENIVSHGVRVTLAEAKLLVERADSYPIDLKNIDSIRDGVETIEKLTEILRNHQESGQRVHMQDLRSVLGTGEMTNFHSGAVGITLEMFAKANQFLEKLQKLFFGNNPHGSGAGLLEVLAPRQVNLVRDATENSEEGNIHTDELNESTPSKAEETEEETNGSPEVDIRCHPFDLDLNDQYDLSELASLFERACLDEQSFFERLRESNCLKSALDSDTREESAQLRRELRWCVCGGRQLGTMIQCDSCFDWFHVSCTRMAQIISDGLDEFALIRQLVENIQFMCDFCQRGIRPPLDLLCKLFYEYRSIQRYIILPEMDLVSRVIARAEKWRKAATNVINELPAIVQQVNTISDRDSEVRIRRRTRDAVLALLLEGNLLEIKLPEWLFLYDFVHENFRKDRQDEELTAPMILPARIHGRFPIAIDMISPLFRQLSKNWKNTINGSASVDMMIKVEEGLLDGTMADSEIEAKYGVKRKLNGSKKAASDFNPGHSPKPERAKRIMKKLKYETNFAPSLFTPSGTVKGRPRGRRKKVQNLEGLAAAPVGVEEDSGMENCYSCKKSFPVELLPSTIVLGRIVPMCHDCKLAGADISAWQKSNSESNESNRASAKRNGSRSTRPKPKV